MSWSAFQYARCTELIDFGFDDDRAALLTDAGFCLCPNRFRVRATGVKAARIPAKHVHDGAPCNVPETFAAPVALPGGVPVRSVRLLPVVTE